MSRPLRILGSQEFADRLRRLLLHRDEQPEIPSDRTLRGVDVSAFWLAVTNHYGVAQEALGERSRHTEMRSVAARVAKRQTAAPLKNMAAMLGLGRETMKNIRAK